MALTDEQEQRLNEILETCESARHRLSKWEEGFLDDQSKRYAEHKSAMSLSPKQWQVLEPMFEKVA